MTSRRFRLVVCLALVLAVLAPGPPAPRDPVCGRPGPRSWPTSGTIGNGGRRLALATVNGGIRVRRGP